VVVGVDDHLGGTGRRLESREAVLEDDDLEARARDLGRLAARPGGAQRAVLAARQEGAILAVDRVDDLLVAQLVVADLAQLEGSTAE
jgi:hypothetical protein